MSKRKAKKVTLRQRMRLRATVAIDDLEKIVVLNVGDTLKEAGIELNPYDVMRLFGNRQVKHLREKAVIALADQYEAELEALYNKQIGLPLGDDNAAD